jgi:triacylglycerol lipase
VHDVEAPRPPHPVLLVHGLWDSPVRLRPMSRGLLDRGIHTVATVHLRPADGSAPIAALAEQVRAHAEALAGEHGHERVDIVGFSMGALASRYYVQRGGGRGRTRRFISISGPHNGTLTAYGLPLAGVRQMRPGSALLAELASDPDPWGQVEVHCIYTPFDMMIVPSESSVLKGARSVHRVPVPVHRWMIRDKRVLDLVAKLLTA